MTSTNILSSDNTYAMSYTDNISHLKQQRFDITGNKH